MSTSHTTNPTPIQNGRKRPATSKIIPAVPLPMSKPRRQTQIKALEDGAVGFNSQSQSHLSVDAKHRREDCRGRTNTGSSIADASQELKHDHSRSAENGICSPNNQNTEATNGTASSFYRPMTPDHLQNQANTTITPPALAGAVTGGNSFTPSSRQSPDILNMHPIKSGIPSAFTPSAERQTPQSTFSSRTRRAEFPAPIPLHSSRASASSIIFGSHDNIASPSAMRQHNDTPEARPPFHPPVVASNPKPFPNFAHQAATPQSTFPLHSIHSPPFTPFSQQQQHQPLDPHSSYRQLSEKSKNDVRLAVEVPYTNGHHSRSGSQSSPAIPESLVLASDPVAETTKYIMPEDRSLIPETPLRQRPLPPQFHQSQPSIPPPPPDFQANIENAEMIRNHVRSHFNNPDLADCHLQITDMHGGRKYLDSHKIILSRSPTLLMLIQSSEPPQSAALKTQVHVHLSTPYITLEAFLHALHYLYGEPILTPQRVMSAPSPVRRMRLALEDAAVGVWLKAPVLMMRAIDLATSQMQWETISDALAFALDGGLSHMWLTEDVEDKSSTDSADEFNGRPEVLGIPTYEPAASQLLHRIIDFTLHMFPPDFFLDISAPQLDAVQRLPPPQPPHRRESRHSISDPRLSQIRFGEMGARETRPSPITTLVSSMLLSIPFPILKVILEHHILTQRLGIDTVASIMRAVVVEREARRNRALSTGIAEHIETYGASTAVQNLNWVESVEVSAQHRVGFRLTRSRKGIDTPASSGDGH